LGPISPFNPASGQALVISNLFILTLVIGGMILFAVALAVWIKEVQHAD
jgi:hypothetical protein